MITNEDRVKRLRWRRHPHTAAELRSLALGALSVSPRCLPAWADLAKLVGFYVEALQRTRETGIAHEVDHYYPLLGETVCGLHVPLNVRVISAAANASKGNRLPDDAETWPPFDIERTPRKSGRRPTNQPYHAMFPNSLLRSRRRRQA